MRRALVLLAVLLLASGLLAHADSPASPLPRTRCMLKKPFKINGCYQSEGRDVPICVGFYTECVPDRTSLVTHVSLICIPRILVCTLLTCVPPLSAFLACRILPDLCRATCLLLAACPFPGTTDPRLDVPCVWTPTTGAPAVRSFADIRSCPAASETHRTMYLHSQV